MKRNSLHGPGYSNVDLSLFRHFPLTEKLGMEFRAEAYNVLNNPEFANPNNSRFSGQGLGTINNTRFESQRQIQFGARFTF